MSNSNKSDRISGLLVEMKKYRQTSNSYIKALMRQLRSKDDQIQAAYLKGSNESVPQNAYINYREPFPFDWYSDFNNDNCPLLLPPGVEINKDGRPSLGCTDTCNIYGQYTVFTSYSGECYHQSRFCSYLPSLRKTQCIFDVVRYKRPCSKCSRPTPDAIPKWYLNYQRASRTLEIDWSEDQ